MSELRDYIETTLKNKYTAIDILADTAVHKLTLYEKNDNHKKLVLIQSGHRNDEVFRILKSLPDCKYLPTIYEVCSDEEFFYTLEEYIEGIPLIDINQRKLSQKQIISYIIDICSALEILHSHEIVHRDIKPENIIIKNETAVLIDLSIAKIINQREIKDTINLGTVGYAAPEQFGVTQSSPATDIYALGVLANELTIGAHPTVDLPKGKLGRIIKKCTSTQISKRYQSAEELKKALKTI